MDELYHLLERIGTMLRAEARSGESEAGLQSVHLQILAYLDVCNRYSDTPSAVTEYLGVTKGTASQSIARLEEKGLIRKRPDPDDGRMVRLALTKRGSALLDRTVPGRTFAGAARRMPAVDRMRLTSLLRDFLRGLQKAHGSRSFGVCRTCRFHVREGRGRYRCGLTDEPLSSEEIELLCREHEPLAVVRR